MGKGSNKWEWTDNSLKVCIDNLSPAVTDFGHVHYSVWGNHSKLHKVTHLPQRSKQNISLRVHVQCMPCFRSDPEALGKGSWTAQHSKSHVGAFHGMRVSCLHSGTAWDTRVHHGYPRWLIEFVWNIAWLTALNSPNIMGSHQWSSPLNNVVFMLLNQQTPWPSIRPWLIFVNLRTDFLHYIHKIERNVDSWLNILSERVSTALWGEF